MCLRVCACVWVNDLALHMWGGEGLIKVLWNGVVIQTNEKDASLYITKLWRERTTQTSKCGNMTTFRLRYGLSFGQTLPCWLRWKTRFHLRTAMWQGRRKHYKYALVFVAIRLICPTHSVKILTRMQVDRTTKSQWQTMASRWLRMHRRMSRWQLKGVTIERGSNWEGQQLKGWQLTGATIERVKIDRCQLTGVGIAT